MSRSEADREDLLREATALIERVELQLPGYSEPIVVGFRKDGAASFFFGANPVYQFNTASELRRAYAGGLLYKAEAGRLVSLRRERSATETALVRHELTPDKTAALLAGLTGHFEQLRAALQNDTHQVLREVPPAANLPPQILAWLQQLPATIPIANAPHVHTNPKRKRG
jgi:hypothetical protein